MMADGRIKRWLTEHGSTTELTGDDFFLPDLCQAQSLFYMVLVAELLVFVLLLSDSGLASFSWMRLGLTSLFVQWVVLTSAAILCNIRPILKDVNIAAAVIVAYGLVLSVTLLFSLLAEWALRGGGTNGLQVDWTAVTSKVLISAIITGLGFRYLYLQHQLRSQEQAELTARIQALQSRIRPHFLFNSMNIIASLIAVEPDTAERVVEDLSLLFRASLNESTNRPVSLKEEISLCERYIRIEGLRLGDRLQVDWDVAVDPEKIEIPMLTLQPLLENAIYHGIQPLPDGGIVKVELHLAGGKFHIRVTNPVATQNQDHEKGNKMAVDNIRHRLRAIYGTASDIQTQLRGPIYETLVSYPIDTPQKV
ncbi:MAG: histidine kinase [Pseudomonadales bacterium]|jgi:two-component system sensor histidine kinase AlgZ|nr:histidine kinase [Pseudomonadales bacterium]MDP7146198.1 histidine kinase [Pseudomonadales bacterium]MDP7360541.1 histidine kinase [Pseudomonadales bacterium]MDP7598012.1 histidine kinase [Pseudomonadales bacterium]HJN49355.1 histidine kinase [Pseudomonadales bacterium]